MFFLVFVLNNLINNFQVQTQGQNSNSNSISKIKFKQKFQYIKFQLSENPKIKSPKSLQLQAFQSKNQIQV